MIGAIIQARTSSKRFPNKILKDLPINSGINVLQQVVRRLKKCQYLDLIIIATTNNKEDEIICNISDIEQIPYFRGDRDDVLSRFYLAAKNYHLDHILRITSDCPCLDPKILDDLIKKHLNENGDYTSNSLNRTFIHGMDAEVVTFQALEDAYNNATDKYDREHVLTYLYRTNPAKYKRISLELSKEDPYFAPNIRLTLDTEDDYILLCAVYDYLYNSEIAFTHKDLVELFKKHPWLNLINSKVLHKKKLTNFEEEYQEAIRLLDLQGLNLIKEKLYKIKDF